MSPWQGGELLQPVTAEQPCGESLEDTPLLASFDTFHLFGQSTPLDPIPAWSDIRNQAIDALAKSHDLRLLAYLGAALLRIEGVTAFTATLGVAATWLETQWAGTYPLIDEDALLRRNALNCFADSMGVVDGLRRTPLVSSRQHGMFSIRDLDIAAGLVTPTDKDARPDEAAIAAAFAEMPLDDLKTLQQGVTDGLGALKRINAVMSTEGGPEMMADFEPLSAQLAKADRTLRAQLAGRVGTEAEGGADEGADGGVQVRAVGAIKSRQDAIRALDAVANYFRQNEPSSPIPMFVERAKRLVSKDFLEVLADIAPDAIGQARSAGGLPQE